MHRRTAAGLATVALLLSASVWAANNGAPDTELEIGGITTFDTQADARTHCGRDTVIWADRYAGYIYFPREPQYGRSEQGAFACLHDALNSNYWTTGPLSSMAKGHGPGRVFPFTPISNHTFIGS